MMWQKWSSGSEWILGETVEVNVIKIQISNSIVRFIMYHQMHYDALIDKKYGLFSYDMIISHICTNLGNEIISSTRSTLRLVE